MSPWLQPYRANPGHQERVVNGQSEDSNEDYESSSPGASRSSDGSTMGLGSSEAEDVRSFITRDLVVLRTGARRELLLAKTQNENVC